MQSLRRMSTRLREDEDYRNFRLAAHCSACFLGIYTAVYSAQNLQAGLFQELGFGALGLVSNAVAYLGQGIGSIYSVYFVYKAGDVKSMGFASLLNIPFILCLLFPTLKEKHPDSQSFIFSSGFIWIVIILTTFINGFG